LMLRLGMVSPLGAWSRLWRQLTYLYWLTPTGPMPEVCRMIAIHSGAKRIEIGRGKFQKQFCALWQWCCHIGSLDFPDRRSDRILIQWRSQALMPLPFLAATADNLPPAIGSSRLAARLERLRLMAQLYVGKNPISKGIGRIIRRS